ncbi:MAG: hypothetical protein KA152_06265 [Verrucomicrobiales bacterium]|nr:hypothetical protein [Verrucomicrobiales bacterium]HQW29895.1 hypothetical protein [Verrucomicrobiales bacterium]
MPAIPPLPPENETPKVIVWFRVYCSILCFLYLVVTVASAFLLSCDPSTVEMSETEQLLVGALMLLMGLVLFIASLLPLILKPRRWLWMYDLIIICLGMTSACFLPACVPLLIFWMKPEVKKHFGVS